MSIEDGASWAGSSVVSADISGQSVYGGTIRGGVAGKVRNCPPSADYNIRQLCNPFWLRRLMRLSTSPHPNGVNLTWQHPPQHPPPDAICPFLSISYTNNTMDPQSQPQQSPLLPPGPFSDFEFSFDPSLTSLFPNPPPLPSSADLFSPAETSDLLGFLDNFGTFNFDLDYIEPTTTFPAFNHHAPYSNPHLHTSPDPSTSNRQRNNPHHAQSRAAIHSMHTAPQPHSIASGVDDSVMDNQAVRSMASESSPSATGPPPARMSSSKSKNHVLSKSDRAASVTSTTTFTNGGARPKPLLSTPQKRLNHIMSEQKRRNAIRDGYAQLISLLAPAGAPGLDMPTRGRPKGSGSRGKGQTKGKSGVLFRAVEYCRWLEEGRDALRTEVMRLEEAAGINPPS